MPALTGAVTGERSERRAGIGFVRRVYRLRMVGSILGGISVGGVLVEQHSSLTLMILLVVTAVLWPPLAFRLAICSEPVATGEQRNIAFDAFLLGYCVAAMHFRILPSSLLLAVAGTNAIGAGGIRLLVFGVASAVLGLALGASEFGAQATATAGHLALLAALPMLIIYPLSLGKMTYDMSRKLRQRSETMRAQAERDRLTGLFNRERLTTRLEEMLAVARFKTAGLAILFIDLDQFKAVNDSLGHGVGDQVLKLVAERLQEASNQDDLVSRYGGDEFVLVRRSNCKSAIAGDLDTLLTRLAEPLVIGGHELYIEASVGISRFPDDGDSAEVLLKKADTAMYFAKDQGRNGFQFFVERLEAASHQRLELSTDLRKAVKAKELYVLYQPQVDLRTGRVTGVEALVRWRRRSGEHVSPNIFIELAEQTGLIYKIGEWVLETACRQSRAWEDQGLRPVTMSVNLSPVQLRRGNIVETIRSIVDASGMSSDLLELELTEGALMENADESASFLNELRSAGITIAIDDFGTGYSSLSYLKKFNIDRIKIDRSFVHDIGIDTDDEAITRAIIALAQALHFEVIAEGVETAPQRAFLLEHGCSRAQGFYYSPAVLPELIADMLRQPEPQRSTA